MYLLFVCFLTFIISKQDELRIYKNFAEITKPLENLSLKFSEEDWKGIDPRYLKIDGCTDYDIRVREQETDAENTTVFVNKNGTLRRAVLVNAINNLLKDDETGRYFIVDKHSIEYERLPSEKVVFVDIGIKNATCSSELMLSYIQRAVKWSRHNTLCINDTVAQFIVWADISNMGKKILKGDNVELFVGDLELIQYRPFIRSYSLLSDSGSYKSEELYGLRVYTINHGIEINSKEILRVKLFTPYISFIRLGCSHSVLTSGTVKGKFDRTYRIVTKDFIPDGSVIIRENNRIVGETSMPSVAAGEEYDIKLGLDPELHYERSARLVSNIGNDTLFNIDLVLTSYKNRSALVEYTENVLRGYIGESEVKYDANVTIVDSKLTVKAMLEPSQQKRIFITLLVKAAR